MSVDQKGNIYVTGAFTGAASFGDTTLTSKGKTDIFVAKLSPKGVWLWARRAGGSDEDTGRAIAHDPQGNVYIAGVFELEADFGKLSLRSKVSNIDFREAPDAFAAKLDPEGNWLWVTQGPSSTTTDSGQGIGVDGGGNVYLFSSVAHFSFNAPGGQIRRHGSVVINKLGADGKSQWQAHTDSGTGASTGRVTAHAMSIGPRGHVYVCGHYEGSPTFGRCLQALGRLTPTRRGWIPVESGCGSRPSRARRARALASHPTAAAMPTSRGCMGSLRSPPSLARQSSRPKAGRTSSSPGSRPTAAGAGLRALALRQRTMPGMLWWSRAQSYCSRAIFRGPPPLGRARPAQKASRTSSSLSSASTARGSLSKP